MLIFSGIFMIGLIFKQAFVVWGYVSDARNLAPKP